MINPVNLAIAVLGAAVMLILAVATGRLIKRNGDDEPMANPYYDPKTAIAGNWLEEVADLTPNRPIPMGEGLCEDEGCEHYGTPHVCIERSHESYADLVNPGAFSLEEYQAVKLTLLRGKDTPSYTDARHSRPFFGQAPHKYVPGIPAFVYYSAEAGNFYWAGDSGALGLGNEFHAAWLPWAHLFPQSGEGFKP